MTAKEDSKRQIEVGKKLRETSADQLNQKKVLLDNVRHSFAVQEQQAKNEGYDLITKDLSTNEMSNMDVAPMNVPKALKRKKYKSWRYRFQDEKQLLGDNLDNLRNSHFNFELIQNIAAPRLGSLAQSRPGRERFRDSFKNFDDQYRSKRLFNRQDRADFNYAFNVPQRI